MHTCTLIYIYICIYIYIYIYMYIYIYIYIHTCQKGPYVLRSGLIPAAVRVRTFYYWRATDRKLPKPSWRGTLSQQRLRTSERITIDVRWTSHYPSHFGPGKFEPTTATDTCSRVAVRRMACEPNGHRP